MSVLDAKLDEVARSQGGGAKDRLLAELNYARRVSLVNGNRYDALLGSALDAALVGAKAEGAITNALAASVEQMLSPMGEACKKYRLLMVGHAHIDMNWMWRFDETVSITLDTFRTMLNLMKEYPEFTFAQSQASTYKIVEDFEPGMLAEIRERIRGGQWEVSASTWVEADRNMPSAESVARHFLYTKKYLPKLLGIDAEALKLDYEPDTFGHNASVPEMLSQAGVKYYYHCRGEEGRTLYRWRGETGAEILVYLEPDWYLGPVTGENALFVPEFCDRFGTDTALNVYGVGDHGGGPTRRDIQTIIDMKTWPIFPRVEFGSYKSFYEAAEACWDRIPVLTGERNPVFTGCYTTQTRIKRGNRSAEKKLFEAESVGAFAHLFRGAPYSRLAFETAWERVLFNQFHDIIPGSGVIDTREYAMGNFQEAYAAAESAKRLSRAAIAAGIDTASLTGTDLDGSTGEGAGVGFGVEGLGSSQVSRGGGLGRVYHLFNSVPADRRQVVDLILWDYQGDMDRVEAVDGSGKALRLQWIDRNFNEYWQHHWARLCVEVDLPALGYQTVALRLRDEKEPRQLVRADPRVEKPFEMLLENECVRAEFDPANGKLLRLIDKASGEARALNGAFRFVREDPNQGMTSWVVGRTMEEKEIGGAVKIVKLADGPLYKAYRLETAVGKRSKLTAVVSLRAGSDTVDYEVKCDWQETGDRRDCIPQLAFAAELTEKTGSYLYDIPGGLIERSESSLDMPSQGLIASGGVKLLCDSRYGFRGNGGALRATLIRSAFDPDPYPEQGEHVFRLGIGLSAARGNALLTEAAAWNRPVEAVSGSVHAGEAPLCESFLKLTGACLSGVKLCEDEYALIVRLLSAEGEEAKLEFSRAIKSAVPVNALEREMPGDCAVSGGTLCVQLPAGGVRAWKIIF